LAVSFIGGGNQSTWRKPLTLVIKCIVSLENCIGGVMVTMVAWSVVEQGFKPWSGKIKKPQNWHLLLLCSAGSIKESI
jgi:hypothetical protein